MWQTILGGLFGPVINAVSSYVQHKQEITKIEREGEIKRLQSAIDNEAKWDELQAQGSGSSWKDEYLTIILSIPLIGCFVPGGKDYILGGFGVLEQTPVWYQAAIGVMIAAAFGVKSFAKYMESKNGDQSVSK